MQPDKPRYIPALHCRWLTPLYDPLLGRLMPERELKGLLVRQAGIEPGHRVLDLGCGTASLALMAKGIQPEAYVAGLDIDPDVLAIARRKAAHAGVALALQQGDAVRLPYPDGAFDRVLAGFLFHHLTRADKQRAAQEAYRVLKGGGELHVLDFGQPHTRYGRALGWLLRWVEEIGDNLQGLLPQLLRSAGFAAVEEPGWRATLFGNVSLYRARKP